MKLKLTLFLSIFCWLLYGQSAPAYYAGIDFTKTGNVLKSEVADRIIGTHEKMISYGELLDLLKVSDVDPENSNNLLLIYGSQSSGKHQRSRSIGGSWNREHVYAKSRGTPNLGTSGAGADGHHLRPADVGLNSDRGNLLFDDGLGAMAHVTSRGGWYPGDEWKGDVARILMYMYVRYQSQCKPLNITMNPSTYSADFPDILLKWNVEDPVSAFEVQRNNSVAQTQKNRNPFIDNPYLATVIWGGPAAQNTWPDTFGPASGDTQAPSVPTSLQVTSATASLVSLSWTASIDNIAVAGYDVYADNILKTTVSTNSATVSALNPATVYNFHVVAKDAAGNRSAASQTVQATTQTAGTPQPGTTCGTEDFENIPSTGSTPPASSYEDRTWTSNGIIWTATKARTDKQIYIDGDNNKAICLRKGSLKSSVISGGVGSLSVKTYLAFADSAGSYTLMINGEAKGQIPYGKTAKTTKIENINVEGDVVIELIDNATSNRVSFDNLSWTCYSTMGTQSAGAANKKISIYPNPVKNQQFFISGVAAGELIKIYSVSGQLLQTVQSSGEQTKVVTNRLPKGVYFITTKTQSAKIMVE